MMQYFVRSPKEVNKCKTSVKEETNGNTGADIVCERFILNKKTKPVIQNENFS